MAPALFTRTSSSPTRSASAACWSERPRSRGWTSTSAPWEDVSSAATPSRSPAERATRLSRHPSAAKTSAQARPMPFEAPVTTTCRPPSPSSMAGHATSDRRCQAASVGAGPGDPWSWRTARSTLRPDMLTVGGRTFDQPLTDRCRGRRGRRATGRAGPPARCGSSRAGGSAAPGARRSAPARSGALHRAPGAAPPCPAGPLPPPNRRWPTARTTRLTVADARPRSAASWRMVGSCEPAGSWPLAINRWSWLRSCS